MRFLFIVFINLLTLTSCQAQTPISSAELYKAAQVKLRRGKDIDRAIEILKQHISNKPEDIEARLELASAYAGKSHILAKAVIDFQIYEKFLAKHKIDYDTWSAEQKKPDSVLFDTPPPVKPLPPRYSDTNQPCTGLTENIKNKISNYVKLSLRELDRLSQLQNSKEDSSKINLTAAWVYALLWEHPRLILDSQETKSITPEKAIAYLDKILTDGADKNIVLVKSDLLDFFGDFDYYRYLRSNNIDVRANPNPKLLADSYNLLEQYLGSVKSPPASLKIRLAILKENRLNLEIANSPRAERTASRITEEIQWGLNSYKELYQSSPDNFFIGLIYATKLYLNDYEAESLQLLSSIDCATPSKLPYYTYHSPESLRAFIPSKKLLPNTYRYISLAIRNIFSKPDKLSQINPALYISRLSKTIEITDTLSAMKSTNPQFEAVFQTIEKMNNKFMILSLQYFAESNPELRLPGNILSYLSNHKTDIHATNLSRIEFDKLINKQK